MGGMEFTWRMVSTLAWPAAVVIIVLVFRRWIVERLDLLGITLGSLGVQLKTLDLKVNRVGEDVSVTLSENTPGPASNTPGPASDAEIPQSLVDLMATVNKNRMEGIRAAFDLVHRALKENYPQLRRVLPSQLPEAMHRLVDRGEMEGDVAMSVQQLYELLVMPEWEKDDAGGTRAYAFLMLAEGAIHGILRSARDRGEEAGEHSPGNLRAPIATSWRGVYNNAYDLQLDIAARSDGRFEGTMTYPDGGTITRVVGSIESAQDGIRLRWEEREVTRQGSRRIDLNGYYLATIENGDTMRGAWYHKDRLVARFTLTAPVRSSPSAE